MKRRNAALVVLVLIALALLVFLRTRHLKLTGIQIAERASFFLTSATRNGDDSYDRLECDAAGNCTESIANRNTIPTFAWRLLAFAGLYKATGNKIYGDAVREEFDWFSKQHSDMADTLAVNFHQVYETYVATRDERVLRDLRRSLARVLNESRAMFRDYAEWTPMPTATVARELFQGYSLLKDPQALQSLAGMGMLGKMVDAERQWFLEEAERVLEVAEAKVQSRPVIANFSYRPESCFVQWSKAAAYRATTSEKYVRELRQYFEENQLAGRDRQAIFLLQEVLPCIAALSELSTVDRFFGDQLTQYVQNLLIPAWDSSLAAKCAQPDEGFLGIIEDARSGCPGNVKGISDAGWAIFIFSAYKDSLEVQ